MIHSLQFMRTMFLGLNAKRQSEEGATAVEYGLMVALIAAAIIITVGLLGTKLSDLFSGVDGKITVPA
jgi:pilus assembly protein Flp/PilA